MTATKHLGGAVHRPGLWGPLAGCLLDFEAFPGRYPLALREPRLLFDHGTEVLALARGRTLAGLSCDGALEARMRRAARFFVRTALLRPGVDNYTLLGLAPGFDPAVLREHYRMLIRLTHPDFAADSGEWPAGAATRINQANDVLSSPLRQQEYALAHGHGRQWDPSSHASAMPRTGGRHATQRHRTVLAAAAGAGVVLLGVWLWPGTPDGETGGTLAQGDGAAQPAPMASVPVPMPMARVSAPGPLTSRPAAAVLAGSAAAFAPARPAAQSLAAALAPASAGLARPPAGARASLAPIPAAALAVTFPARPAPAPASTPAWAAVPAVSRPPASSVVPVAVAAAVVAPPVSVPVPQPALPAPQAAAAPMTPVSLADVQPLLGHLLGALQSGSGEQVLRWVERPVRAGEGADGFVQTYNRVVGQSRSVRLGAVRFSGRPVGDQLQVDGVVMLHLQDENQQAATRELVLRAQFAARDGQPVMTQLSASESPR